MTIAWSAGNTLSLISLLASAVAVTVSSVAVRHAVRAHRDKATTDAVTLLYAQFQTFSDLRVANWEISHIFEPPEFYAQTCDALKRALTLTDARKHELILKERAIALRIFDLFEQVIFQRDAARRQSDTMRVAFLGDVLNYFTGKWLRNPRLLYLWHSELKLSFEPLTLAYHDAHIVSSDPAVPLERDATGPYESPP